VHIHIDHSGQAPTAATVTSSGASPPEEVAAEYVDAYAHYDRARRKSVLGGDALANWPNLSNYNRADEAIEFTILLDRCSPQPGAGTDISVTCTFDMHGFGPRQPANPLTCSLWRLVLGHQSLELIAAGQGPAARHSSSECHRYRCGDPTPHITLLAALRQVVGSHS
jgi:hypothetical protein